MKFKTTYSKGTPNGAIQVVTETLEVEDDEVAELLTMAMAGNVQDVDGEVIRDELERRGETEEESA